MSDEAFVLVPPTNGDDHGLTQFHSRVATDINYVRGKCAKLGKKLDKLEKLRLQVAGAVITLSIIGGMVGWYIQSQIIAIQGVMENAKEDHRLIAGPPPLRTVIETVQKDSATTLETIRRLRDKIDTLEAEQQQLKGKR